MMLLIALILVLIPSHVVCHTVAAAVETDQKKAAAHVDLKLKVDACDNEQQKTIAKKSIKDLLEMGLQLRVQAKKVETPYRPGSEQSLYQLDESWMPGPVIRTEYLLNLSGLGLTSLDGIDQIPDYLQITQLNLTRNNLDRLSQGDLVRLCMLQNIQMLGADEPVAQAVKSAVENYKHLIQRPFRTLGGKPIPPFPDCSSLLVCYVVKEKARDAARSS